MAITRNDLIAHLEELLSCSLYRDYGPNGLQVEGSEEITRLATACTANLKNCEATVSAQCQALLVHHGIYWGKAYHTATGMLGKRLRALIAGQVNLLGYHLPLDGHPEIGNNAVGLKRLDLVDQGGFADDAGPAIGRWGEPTTGSYTIDDLIQRCGSAFNHAVIHCPGGPDTVRRIGIITGGGQSYLGAAAELGLDVLITGETSEQSWHEAAELGCHLLACGHHATESIAVHELGQRLATEYQLDHVALNESNPL